MGMAEKMPAYLDNNATTPVRPEVLAAMAPVLSGVYGNPNSVHSAGQRARKAVEEARAAVARLVGAASPEEIVFTSCGSEGNVAAVQGAALAAWDASGGKRRHIVTSAVEHASIHGLLKILAARGFESTVVGVDRDGRVSPESVREALRPETFLVSVMAANNEVGTLQPLAEIAALCRERGILLHSDAVQAAGKVPIDVVRLGADLLSIAGHKFYAPKGVGALYVRSGVRLTQTITGHQEKNRRGGTENTASIVGMGVAADLALRELPEEGRRLAALRDRLEKGVEAAPGVHRTSRAPRRLPATSHFCFEGVEGHHLVVALDLEGVCVSSGPACEGGVTGLSHVLKAMGVPPELGRGALRVSLGHQTTDADVDRFLAVLPACLERLRAAGVR